MKPVNLIPQDQRRRGAADSGGKGAPIALGVLAALLAMVVGYVLQGAVLVIQDLRGHVDAGRNHSVRFRRISRPEPLRFVH